jgi:hypothetical protein
MHPLYRQAVETRFDPEPWDLLVQLHHAAAAGDTKAAGFISTFTDWLLDQERSEAVVSHALGMRAL